MSKLNELTTKLSEIGNIDVIKDDYVFSLLMVDTDVDFTKQRRAFKIMELVTDYIPDKPNVEVFKNDHHFVMIILKP